jgi:predicted DNA-binding protein
VAVSAKSQKTYSFRASSELGERLREARAGFDMAARDAELSAHLGNEFGLALLRRLHTLSEDLPDGVFIREIVEAFVSAGRRVRSEQEQMEELRAFDREDTEGEAWRRGAMRLVAARIAAEGD